MKSSTFTVSAIPLPDMNSDDEENNCDRKSLYASIDGDRDTVKPVSVDNLWNYIRDKKYSKIDGLKQEYDVSILKISHIII